QREKHPAPQAQPAAQGQLAAPGGEAPKPSTQLQAPGAVPAAPAAAAPAQEGAKAVVKTDVLVAEISAAGGDLRRLELSQYSDKEDKAKRFVLFEDQPGRVYVAQQGLIAEGLPTHKSSYSVTPGTYELAEGADKIELRLAASEGAGAKVTKVYTFRRGSYVIDVRFEVENTGAAAIAPHAYFQLLRDGNPAPGDTRMVPTYTGAAVYTEEGKFHKVDFSAMEKGKTDYPKAADNGWVAMVQHYFVAAWLAEGKVQREFYTRRVGDNLYSAGLIVPVGSVEPGKTGQVEMRLYAGPQEQDKLSKLAPGLDLVVDYGWLTFLAVPLFWVLELFHRWVGNWGVAIILLTVMIKLLFYPLSAASYKSMAKMKAVAPKLQRIKELYGDDRQRLHQAMMELYKTEKINPMGGCLPIVVQIPVFIALYWVLLQSVELRQAPFMLWIQDLAAPDPYYVLPIVMAATMFLQTRLNPTPPDPIQARMMQIMPIAFSVFFFFFPAGLVLYWLVNNILSIAQQWRINQVLEMKQVARS
ncbi:MAG TPA: membrane protein insertase YidC, partial [Burkholderiales bacterium]|nr:membrane protein insertase YidC [Burkholderiales bacterium]